MGGAPAPAPMDGASDVPPGPMGPNGPEGDPAGAPMDGPMGGPDGGMGGDVPPGGDGQLDPNMGEPGMGEEPPMDGPEGEGEDDSTMSLFNQLSDEDKEAARGYIESMLSRDEESGPAAGGEEQPMGGPDAMGGPNDMGGDPNAAPMMEVVFTKKQLNKLSENLITTEPEDRREKSVEKKKGNGLAKKSPFNSPKFK